MLERPPSSQSKTFGSRHRERIHFPLASKEGPIPETSAVECSGLDAPERPGAYGAREVDKCKEPTPWLRVLSIPPQSLLATTVSTIKFMVTIKPCLPRPPSKPS